MLGPEPAQGPVLVLVPERALVPVRQAQVPPERALPELVRRASWVLQEPVQAPVCWPPVARQAPDAHHRFFRKHNTRQPPE
ncbi:hypothetical protein ACFSQT_26535 [Mesorhizobium calcicola]|uniref:Uncharacterized protein n=1 Tax=Mesorhizobium calcicola TaxID=1300310 RepID=A0ABW4WKM5_9HYPH